MKAAEEMELDLGASMLLGDKESDVEAGQNAGLAKTIRLLETGKTKEDSKADVVIYDVRELLKSR